MYALSTRKIISSYDFVFDESFSSALAYKKTTIFRSDGYASVCDIYTL